MSRGNLLNRSAEMLPEMLPRKTHKLPATMFRFTIRDVLWLMAVMGLGLALWATRVQLKSEGEISQNWERTARYFVGEFYRDSACPVVLHEDGRYTVYPPPFKDSGSVSLGREL